MKKENLLKLKYATLIDLETLNLFAGPVEKCRHTGY